MIETHAHVYDRVFDEDRDATFERARKVGVQKIWMPNCNSETTGPMMKLADTHKGFCVPMMGLHPCYVAESYGDELETVEKQLKAYPFQMIGEIGLDFYWDLSFLAEQEEAFLRQLELARAYNLPVCIHSRNSKDRSRNAIVRCCELIEGFGWERLRGVFHCFSGNLDEAKRVLSLGFVLGIGGLSTFKNGGLDKVLPYIEPENIILETDSPYLAPVPYRGKRNEVAYIDLVADRIALLMGKGKMDLIEQTTRNAKKLIP